MNKIYQDLGSFSGLVEFAAGQAPLYPLAQPGEGTIQALRDSLGFCAGPETPLQVKVERTWEQDGLSGEELSWGVGFGPRTHAYFLRPSGAQGPLPAVLALHDHGGFKWCGKEKIAQGPDQPPEMLRLYQARYYGGRAWANALARQGFAVLVHDAFLWGSRRFPWDELPEQVRQTAEALLPSNPPEEGIPPEVARYHLAADQHEHVVAKYLNLLGTCLGGAVSREDRIAFNYLLSRSEVDPTRAGCLGLSGGGNRAVLLRATHPGVRAAGIIGLMSTYEGLLDHSVFTHTWMFFPSNWSRHGDWPDIAACRAPQPLLVQYDLEDDLFTQEGMRAADERLRAHYRSVGAESAYVGQFYPGPHKFDLQMQANAFAWFEQQLG
jgi:dienelactone hydrolase